MGIRVQCPACHSALMAGDQTAGQSINCPKCGSPIIVPFPQANLEQQAGQAPFAGPTAGFPQAGQGTPFPQPGFGAWPGTAGGSKAASSQRTLMIVALAGGGVLVLLLVCLVIWLLVSPSGAQRTATEGAAVENDFAYLPDNCALVAKLRMQPLLASPLWKEMEGQFASMVPASDLQDMRECESVVVGVTPAGAPGQEDDTVVIVRAAAGKTVPFKPEKLPGVTGEETVNGHKVYLHRQATCLVNPRTLLTGSANAIRGVLQRGPAPGVPSRLASLLQQVDFAQPIALCALPSAWPASARPPAAMAGPVQLEKIQSVIVHASVGADMVLSGKIACADAETANGLKGVVDLMSKMMAAGGPAGAKLPAEAAAGMQILQSLKLEVAGNVITANLTVPGKVLIDAARQQTQPRPVPFGVKKSGG